VRPMYDNRSSRIAPSGPRRVRRIGRCALLGLVAGLLLAPLPGWPQAGPAEPQAEPADPPTETLSQPAESGETQEKAEETNDEKTEAKNDEEAAELFKPTPPIRGRYDWIRLHSGEWLKGKIENLRDESLSFDSAELDDLKFDWKDVHEVRSPTVNTYVFEGRRVVVGRAAIDKNWVVISVLSEGGSGIGKEEAEQEKEAPGERSYERKQLVAIIKGERREINYWTGTVSLGFSQRSGNTDQIDFTGYALITREDQFSRVTLSYTSAIGILNDVVNTNNHRGTTNFDVFLNRRFYWTVAAMEAFHDEFQNISVRLVPTTGIGYQMIDRVKLDWSVGIGAGYRYTRFLEVPTSLSIDQQSGVLTGDMQFDWDFTQRVDLTARYLVQMGVPDPDRTDHHAVIMLSVDMTKYVDLDVSWSWDHIGQPAPNAQGEFPDKDDTRLTVGLGVDF
jgi:putative salt-induced outer membrane protein YdiY